MKNILAKLFGGAGGSIAEKISGIIDKHTFSKVEKAQFEKEMEEIFIKAELDLEKRKVNLSIRLLEEIEKKEALEKYGSEGSGKNLPFSSLSDELDKKKKD